MARVEALPGPNEGEDVDPYLMQAILALLIAGINNVDSTQLADGAAITRVIGDDSITQMKLKSGDFVKFAKMRNSSGTLNGDSIVFDGSAGSYKAPRISKLTWTQLKNAVYDLRGVDGENVSITVTRPSIAIYFAMTRVRMVLSGSGAALNDYAVGIYDKGLNASDIDQGLVGHWSSDPTASRLDFRETATIIGMREVATGGTIIPKLAVRIDYEGTLTYTWEATGPGHVLGVLVLPQ